MIPAVRGALGGRRRRRALALLAAVSAVVTVIGPAGAGQITVDIAPTSGPPGTPITLTVTPADGCRSLSWSYTINDSRVPVTTTSFLAWSVGATTAVPLPPAGAPEIPADGFRVFLGVGCYGADGTIAAVACAPIRVLGAGASPAGTTTVPFVDRATLLDSEQTLSPCLTRNAVPAVLMPSYFQTIMNGVSIAFYQMLSPVAATSTTTSTTLAPAPVTTPTTAAPPPTVTPPT